MSELVTFATQDLRVRIAGSTAYIDQRSLTGEEWREIDHSTLPVTEEWMVSSPRMSPLKVALWAFERENPGDTSMRGALRAVSNRTEPATPVRRRPIGG